VIHGANRGGDFFGPYPLHPISNHPNINPPHCALSQTNSIISAAIACSVEHSALLSVTIIQQKLVMLAVPSLPAL
jgi:hypothetical protein